MSLKHIILKRISTDDWLMILAAVALSRLVSDRFLFQIFQLIQSYSVGAITISYLKSRFLSYVVRYYFPML